VPLPRNFFDFFKSENGEFWCILGGAYTPNSTAGLTVDPTQAGHSRSLKSVPFESLGTVSYSPSIVTVAVSVAVCEIFSVKEWRDLENLVSGRSRSLKMAPFDRPYATFYWSAIVNNNATFCHFRVI